jgi:hypothetical protein
LIPALRASLSGWPGIGRIALGMTRRGFDLQLTALRRRRLVGDLLPGRPGVLADGARGLAGAGSCNVVTLRGLRSDVQMR